MAYLYVAIGGALGALGRFLLVTLLGKWLGKEFPYAVLLVNLIGSFLMGVLIAWLVTLMPKGRDLYYLLGVGVLGGFTTFSAFSYDSYTLLERGAYGAAALYIGGSVLGGLLAFFLGLYVMKVVAA